MTNAKIKNTDWKKRLSGFTLFLQNIIKEIGHKNSTAHRCKNERRRRKTTYITGGVVKKHLDSDYKICKFTNVFTPTTASKRKNMPNTF